MTQQQERKRFFCYFCHREVSFSDNGLTIVECLDPAYAEFGRTKRRPDATEADFAAERAWHEGCADRWARLDVRLRGLGIRVHGTGGR